jgi:hypothetical protein
MTCKDAQICVCVQVKSKTFVQKIKMKEFKRFQELSRIIARNHHKKRNYYYTPNTTTTNTVTTITYTDINISLSISLYQYQWFLFVGTWVEV